MPAREVCAIGVDEIAVWAGHKYLTVVYQIDEGGVLQECATVAPVSR